MTPGGVMTDDLIDDVLEVQCELFHRQVLTLVTAKGPRSQCSPPGPLSTQAPATWTTVRTEAPLQPTWTAVLSRMGRRLRPRKSVTTNGREILSSSNSGEEDRGGMWGGPGHRPHNAPHRHVAPDPPCLTILRL